MKDLCWMLLSCWLKLDLVKILSVERENFRLITSWHIILQNPQSTANYKMPRTATRFCYRYSQKFAKCCWNKGIKCMQKTNHTSTRVSDDISSPTRVSNDAGSPIGCWHVSPWKSKHFGQSKDATCLGEKVLKLLQSDCDTCHQSSFATCRSPTPKLL